MSPDKGKSRSGGTAKGSRSRTRQAKPKPAEPERAPEESWTIRPVSAHAQKEWLAAFDIEPDLMAAERERLRLRPLDRSANPRRTGPLHGALARRRVGDPTLPQWQHELTAAGRIWYCPDKDTRTVWIMKVDLAHPKEAD